MSRNAALFHGLASDVDSLACASVPGGFPVLLRPIAERRRITAVEFGPLLVDAMLTTHSKGFRIFFNSNGADALELQRTYQTESSAKMLSPRLRFSLAHELAHTFFYDLSTSVPKIAKRFRAGGGRTVLENLESCCNKLAGHMLLPTPLLQSELKILSSITPTSVRNLAKKAGVSLDVLLRRLGPLLVSRYFYGCIVLANQTADDVSISAIAKPPLLPLATGLRLMQSGERWDLSDFTGEPIFPAQLPGRSSVRLALATNLATSSRLYGVSSEQVGQSGLTKSFLLTFEEIENTPK